MAHAIAATRPGPVAFRAESRRGVEGFYHVAQEEGGQWWLIDPAGKPVWIRAVHGVRSAHARGDQLPPKDSAARLRTWGFETVGIGSDGTGWEDGFAVLAKADFCSAGPVAMAPGLRLPDVFDPQWPAVAAQHAQRMCLPLAENKNVVGWVTDDIPGWAQPVATHAGGAHAGGGGPADRPSLLQLCLSLEPSCAAYHAAWEFVLALHGGRLEALARAWGVALTNKEVVRELTRAEMGVGTRGYFRDEVRWTREYARRYFASTAAAIRAADPNHLVLGCRFGGMVGAHVLAECVYPAVDMAMPDWRELPSHGASAAKDGGAPHPVLASDVCWATPEFLKLPAAARLLRLTSVEWMLRRGRTALERTARHPAATGYAWRQWQDEPGEQPPFARGLVHVDGVEAREHTELLAEFNGRAESIRRAALKSAST